MPTRTNGNLGAMYDLLINRIVIPILLTIVVQDELGLEDTIYYGWPSSCQW